MTAAACTSLILGGARSGKSAFAERLATGSGLERHYLATAQPYDDEMRERIARHRADRGDGWITHEVTLDLVGELERTAASDRVLLVDCLTLWLTNLMMADADIEAAGSLLIDCARKWQGKLVLVSNEVGMGIVPENRMARQFRDHAGRLHQGLAAVADEVYFVAAGLPLKMKG